MHNCEMIMTSYSWTGRLLRVKIGVNEFTSFISKFKSDIWFDYALIVQFIIVVNIVWLILRHLVLVFPPRDPLSVKHA